MAWLSLEEFIEQAEHLAARQGEQWDPALGAILTFCYRTQDPALPPNRNKLRAYVSRYYKARNGVVQPKELGTKADPAVDWILQYFYGVSAEHCQVDSTAHRRSMQAENIVGALLERYIAAGLRPLGWVWCCGSTAKHTDFIHPATQQALQVKNRSNSENAASKSVRQGTTIQHWFRIDARSGQTKWDQLPAPRGTFTDEGFRHFIELYAKEILTPSERK